MNGSIRNLMLFTIPSLIWGSTWLAIKFQLGVVDPIISVFYRFMLASIILLIYCLLRGINLKFKPIDHYFMALQGLLLFGVNYWLVYLAELHLTSGLVALIFSGIVFFNIINSALILNAPIVLRVIVGGLIGFTGIVLVFREEIFSFDLSNDTTYAFILAIIGVVSASLGNISSAYNQKNKLPVISTNAFGMMYGALSLLIISLMMGKSFGFDFSLSYVSSLLYLSIFGSIVAFGAYLTLLGRIGPDRAGYISLVFPIVALLLSSIFENYIWTISAILGVVLILIGNTIVLKKIKKSLY